MHDFSPTNGLRQSCIASDDARDDLFMTSASQRRVFVAKNKCQRLRVRNTMFYLHSGCDEAVRPWMGDLGSIANTRRYERERLQYTTICCVFQHRSLSACSPIAAVSEVLKTRLSMKGFPSVPVLQLHVVGMTVGAKCARTSEKNILMIPWLSTLCVT